MNIFLPKIPSPQTLDMIRRADTIAGQILTQLDSHHLTNITNVIFVSDHGMSSVSSPHFINLTALLRPQTADMYGGSPVVQIVPRTADDFADVLQRLRNASATGLGAGHFNVYTVDELPERWHLRVNGTDNERIGPIVAVADEGWAFEDMFVTAELYERTMNVTRSPDRRYGIHGYDNRDVDMHATFLAMGPSIRSAGDGRKLAGFDNVELYGLMWRLLGYARDAMPATNGTAAGWMVWDAVLRADAVAVPAMQG